MKQVDSRILEAINREKDRVPWRQKKGQRWLKRLLDFLVAVMLLIVLWPIIVTVVVLVKVTSPGPVLFKQARVGLYGVPYYMVKFRSMKALAADGSAGVAGEVTTTDSRLTPIGAFIRAWRLDELPQLFQVLSGQMSLVGPRPDIFDNLSNYTPEQLVRFTMPPGCTAWTFTRGAFANDWGTRQDINVEYVRQWSLWLDIKILVGSFFVLVLQRGTNPEAKHIPAQPAEK